MVVFFSLLHLLTMGQAELTNDEAQYALYGYYLDWSYFDHPPLSGWLNAFILQFSDSDFALRIWPLLLAALTSFLLYGFTRELFPAESEWLGTIAVLLYQASIISQLFGLAMLPDTPLIPIAISAAWLLFRVLKENQQHLWIYVGILFGLAGLSKYTAVTLVVTAILGLIIYKSQKSLITKWPWIAIMLAAIVISPVLYWNIQHDWISISYQLSHGAPEKSWQVKSLLTSQAAQFIAYSPAVFIFGLLAIFSSLKNSNENIRKKNEKYILAFALPVLILFAWMSGYEQTLPHWTALGWIALTPLTAKWVSQHWYKKSVRVFSYFSLIYSFIIIITLHLLLATSLMPFENNKHPLEDIYGWEKVAHQAVALQKEMQKEQNKPTMIFVGNWSQFSRLAWYAKPAPVQVTDQRYGQSDIWYGSAQIGSNGVLVVPPKYKNTTASGVNKFERCEQNKNVSQLINNKKAATYQLYKCFGYKG
ncbi:MAG: glycosyltransferase family 39 protein [Gammaproteobacteria bacterium]|nr:glycosyltransferase family 39 protein [Gammaproteobacteria bacterium]